MKQSIKLLLGGALFVAVPMVLTSCEDILGEWSKPTPSTVTPGDGGGATASGTYLVWNGVDALEAQPIPAAATEWNITSGDVSEGTYIVSSDFTCTGLLVLKGDVTIILKDNATLTVENGIYYDAAGNVGSLTVYAQSQDDSKGSLIVKNDTPYDGGGMTVDPGIWVKALTIHGGLINSKGSTGATPAAGSHYGIEAEDIIIYGGDITATGNHANGSGMECNNAFKIYGGKLTAKGSDGDVSPNVWGAPGLSGTTFNIYGGTVNATGGNATTGEDAAGGTGFGGSDITIDGGTVIAKGGNSGGGGGLSDSGGYGLISPNDITINGGTVTATGGDGTVVNSGAGIASGTGQLKVFGGTTTASGGNKGKGIECAAIALTGVSLYEGDSENPAALAGNQTACTKRYAIIK